MTIILEWHDNEYNMHTTKYNNVISITRDREIYNNEIVDVIIIHMYDRQDNEHTTATFFVWEIDIILFN